ncbi:MAG: type II secretion system GspH family protein, partial [Patescibacteria group bacterium]|nr:type II secretion system GspH family protein [Patescibacteria group bacterium]
MNKLKNTAKPSGFTLIELLIVIAILGVLAVVVLVAVNPVQQLARTRDSGRKSAITQLGRALQAYYTARNGTYVTENATWLDSLVTSGELASAPSAISYASGTAGCTGAAEQNNLCYDYDTTLGRVIVYARMESNVEASKCATGTVAYFVYSSRQGRGGLVCSA